MIVLLVIVFELLIIFSVCFRVVVFNLFHAVFYAVRDFYNYVRYKKWRECHTGLLECYVGLFGKGKTLSAVDRVVRMYKRYNNKKIYDKNRGWVTQKVHIISNVELSIPYEKFVSLSQLVSISERYRELDQENETRTVHIVLGDEFSVQLNSRNFKSNIDPLFLNTLLTCRHHYISLFYTSQRFNHVDALLRQVTQNVISCNKCWRVMVHSVYDANELEHVSNPLDVRPLSRNGWFITDKSFGMYDTLACVDNLARSCREGDMLSEEQILALQQNTDVDMDAVSRPSWRYIKRKKKVGA